MDILLPIHVIAGGAAIAAGGVALLARKGGPVHRRIGLAFVGAMTAMAVSAAVIAAVQGARGVGNLLAASMTIYFVGTAFTAVRPLSAATRRIDVGGVVVAVGIALVDIASGVKAFNAPRGFYNGVPFFMYFFLATILLLAAAGDVRILRHGALRGGQRLSRHLWRMCFALFIAAGSFFSIRERVAKVLPEPFTSFPMRMLPIALIFIAMFYWLWRVRSRRPLPIRHEARAKSHALPDAAASR